jgi:hypothetical protein
MEEDNMSNFIVEDELSIQNVLIKLEKAKDADRDVILYVDDKPILRFQGANQIHDDKMNFNTKSGFKTFKIKEILRLVI